MVGKKRFSSILVVLLILVLSMTALSACTNGQQSVNETTSEEKITLKLSICDPDTADDPYAIGANTFIQLVEAKTNGRVEVKLYPSNQLGSERDVIEGISLGTVEMGLITNAPISGFVPQFQALDLPFIFTTNEEAFKVLDGEFGENLLTKLEDRNIKGLGFAEGGFRHMINNIRPINAPEDTKGVKFRVMENPIYIAMFKALGSNATPMAWGETFTAVQQKTIDGLEIPIPVIHQSKYQEVTEYLSLTNHTYSPLVFMISMKTWNQLPEDIQKAIQESVDEAIPIQRAKNAENVKRLLADLENQGMIVNEVENLELFRASVQSVYTEFESTIGKDIIDALFEAINN
ncbi:MAG: DctP family TRAP transporter solute-binding subunit [Tissierellales bacterium]|nr:DctP family TRAP transporter solute-binding subunit [Tissierellales bacterium]MBN2827011.1 DctP family TRAP transporter solute-binding subunit [Tissierellales bacterium]